jgi:putative transposase
MLTTDAYALWVQRLRLSPEAATSITGIRAGTPVRQVTSHIGNVSGTYPSAKMGGRRIPFESHTVELWAIYLMERDPEVLEYYAQPSRMPLTYTSLSGRATTQWHTPDFFVMRTTSAGWEEWKPKAALVKLARTMPGRYQLDAHGTWRCPPGEAHADALGLTYRVRSSATVPPLLIENLRFLHDYWATPPRLSSQVVEQAVAQVQAHPGITLDHLTEVVSLDVLYALIASETLFTDLASTPLTRHAQVAVFPDPTSATRRAETPTPTVAQHPTAALIWDGRIWLPLSLGEQVTLQPELGPEITLPHAQFQRLLQDGTMRIMTAADPSPTTPEIRHRLATASPKALATANERYALLQTWRLGERVATPRRTLSYWSSLYTAAEREYGCGYVGLLGRISERGSRVARSDAAALRLLDEALATWYATPQKPTVRSVYQRYCAACERQGIPPVGVRTCYRAAEQRAGAPLTEARGGRRAAYPEQPFYWHLDRTTPRHGERPWAIAHLDHTQLDIELVSSVTGKPMGRPWATFLVDAYSRRLLSVYVTYDPPSYRSCLMTLRLCVQRFERLPQDLVVDGGKEFRSVYFESLLARYGVTRKGRPGNEPRFGSVQERLFGTTNTQFIHTLRGNTQATKIPRQMTKEVDPRRLAVWTLAALAERLQTWAYEVYDATEHPALGASPAEMYDLGMGLAGARTHKRIPYTEEFLMLSRPTTHTGHAKVHPGQGVTINYLHYWDDAFRAPGVAGSEVPVRYEPFDLGVAYAYIRNRWVECFADRYAEVHGHSEKEWGIVVAEWRRQQALHGKTRLRADGDRLAQFLAANEEQEALLAQRLRDLEAQSIWGTIPTTTAAARPAPPPPVTVPDTPIDVSSLPRFEEYR